MHICFFAQVFNLSEVNKSGTNFITKEVGMHSILVSVAYDAFIYP